MSRAPFLIFDAAAGSGKTFTLVKEYIKLLIATKDPSYYNQILAITFTNKTVAEMKSRILKNLVAFSDKSSIDSPPEMLRQLVSETNLSIEEIQLRAKAIIKHLLHHYAGFSVETIDRFNHSLIRTFARDLNLATNFEVRLESDELLAEAVDQLISKAGEEESITKLLLDFAIEKADDDKSWDIARDIAQTSRLIFNENDRPHIQKLKQKSLASFKEFKTKIQKERAKCADTVKEIAQQTLQRIAEASLEHSDFNGGSKAYFPAYMLKIASGNFKLAYGAGWQESMGEKPMYPKKTEALIAQTIDALTPEFVASFQETKKHILRMDLYANILKNITPLSVINLVSQELQDIKEEQNILPIAEFNALINKEIKDQPAPFIYERLGERYRHFFIDEFQDTSLLQWENIIPLIDNALSQESPDKIPGSLLLVGDAKQSIYRWRGGLPEQFIQLSQKQHPFSVAHVQVENLPTNYRSCQKLIEFNNLFFTSIAAHFGNSQHQHLYELGNKQAHTEKAGGYVHIEFNLQQEEKEGWYNKQLHNTIEKLTENGFRKEDICVLTRNKKDGVSLSSYLMEQGISVVSSETLLLQNSRYVQCIVYTIALSLYPNNDTLKIDILEILYDHLNVDIAKHDFFVQFLNEASTFSENLAKYNIDFSFKRINAISLYEACEYIIKQFHFSEIADAYLYGLMDFVFEFDQQPQADKHRFLEHWELKKASASIATNQNEDAIEFMTIHKAKGLEFPVVIFPYADVDIYYEREAKTWYPLTETDNDFDEILINYNKQLKNYGPIGEQHYEQRRNTSELDAFNLLYVTLTRAVEQLYIFSEMPSKKKEDKPQRFSQLFERFLMETNQWNQDQGIYTFGRFQRKMDFRKTEDVDLLKTAIVPSYISGSPSQNNLQLVTKDALLWETQAAEAIETGNILHEIMASVKKAEDVPYLIENLHSRALFTEETINALQTKISQIVTHPELKMLFESDAHVKNESSIITASGKILIPDRINFIGKEVVILDYKTGAIYRKHGSQINEYAEALAEMGYRVREKIIVYTSEAEILINKV